MEKIGFHKFSLGILKISENGTAITQIQLVQPNNVLPRSNDETKSLLIQNAIQQIEEYFIGKRKIFDLPLAPAGTQFQKQVWTVLTKIPYGETRTYKQIAEMIGSSKAARAVGLANNRNPIMIVIPCHRVIGTNGSLVGYAGGLEMKEKLLMLEGTLNKQTKIE